MKRQRQASRDEELAAVYDYFEEVAQQNQQWINALLYLHRVMSAEQDTLERSTTTSKK